MNPEIINTNNPKSLTYLSEHPERLVVTNSGFVHLQYYEDPPDGNLAIAQEQKNIPFEIKRVYFINSLQNRDAVRGKHAHRKLKQSIFCINGSFDLDLDDGKSKQVIEMDTAYVGVMLNGMLWHEMRNFSPDCVILVFADEYYDKEDYIRDYDEFKKLANQDKV